MADYPSWGHRGVFCLEGAWDADLRNRGSVLPTLQMLEAQRRCSYVHRDVGTVEEFQHYVNLWSTKKRSYGHYEVLFLAFHGNKGSLAIGPDWISIEDLAVRLRGRCNGKVVYFGSCATAGIKSERLEAFRKAVGARYVAGYRKDVDWITSAAFEMALLDALGYYSRVGDAFNYLERDAPRSLAKSLGFHRHPHSNQAQ